MKTLVRHVKYEELEVNTNFFSMYFMWVVLIAILVAQVYPSLAMIFPLFGLLGIGLVPWDWIFFLREGTASHECFVGLKRDGKKPYLDSPNDFIGEFAMAIYVEK